MTRFVLSLGMCNLNFDMGFISEDEKNPDGSEKEITYGEYVDKINRRALEEQKEIMKAKMKGQLKKADVEDQ